MNAPLASPSEIVAPSVDAPASATVVVDGTPAAPLAAPANAPVSAPAPEPYVDTRFDIGLVMAGAISAGAYTAGVVNFLFRALNAWYDANLLAADGWGSATPPHEVRLKTMGGASAGGMCAALAAISILDGNTARFYDAWVKQIDIRKLLQPDGPQQPPVASLTDLRSVLNCEVLTTIADTAIALPTTTPQWPAWLPPEELNFFLTLTNLNGLCYEVTQLGGSPQRFIDHADRIQYKLLKPGTPIPSSSTNPALKALRILSPPIRGPLPPAQQAEWDELKQAALATGAFPVALLNRQLRFDNDYFTNRAWWYGNQVWPQHVQHAGQPNPAVQPYPAPYLYVDGGVTNNEPLELVRRTLVNDPTGTKPKVKVASADSRHAALMIDPFPADTSEDVFAIMSQELAKVVPALYTTLRNQARYRTEDLLGALDLDESSRFLIAPLRKDVQDKVATPSLASGTLDAFGGFLHEPFREHDYQLGQRNCQQFLQQWFVLPYDPDNNNGLFAKWPAQKLTALARSRPGGPAGQLYLPILPLVSDELRTPMPQPDWQVARMPVATLEKEIAPLLNQRIDWLTGLLKQNLPKKWWWLRASYSWLIKPKLRDLAYKAAMDKVRRSLNKAGLLVPAYSAKQLDDRAE